MYSVGMINIPIKVLNKLFTVLNRFYCSIPGPILHAFKDKYFNLTQVTLKIQEHLIFSHIIINNIKNLYLCNVISFSSVGSLLDLIQIHWLNCL